LIADTNTDPTSTTKRDDEVAEDNAERFALSSSGSDKIANNFKFTSLVAARSLCRLLWYMKTTPVNTRFIVNKIIINKSIQHVALETQPFLPDSLLLVIAVLPYSDCL
jgi:hypothetical protein